jgi:hypothetical protein
MSSTATEDIQMDTLRERRLGRKAIAALSGLAVLAGFGLATLQPAFADDDDWHTEANRPVTQPSPTDADRDDALPRVASRPVRETLYAPPGLVWSVPALRFAMTSYQTADVAPSR